jgi:hypothetical protein
VAWWVIFTNSTKLGFGGAPLEVIHQFGECGGRSTNLVEQIHSRVAASKSVWQRKSESGSIFVDLELVELSQTGPY